MAGVAELFVRAPTPPTPVPLMLSGLAFVQVWPLRSRVAPERTFAAALLVPRAVALFSFIVPTETVVPPP